MLVLVLKIIILSKATAEIILLNHNNKMMMKWCANIFSISKNKIKQKDFSLVFIMESKTLLLGSLNLFLKSYVLFHIISVP